MAAKPAGATPSVNYLHRGITRLQAEQLLLAAKQDGSFLVRESETLTGAFTLCLLVDGRVHQYRIFPDNDGSLSVQSEAGVKQRTYSDLPQLIQQYVLRGQKNGLAGPLLHPVCIEVDDDIDDDEGEKVEEVDNLQYEIIPPSEDPLYSSHNDTQAAFDDFITHHFLQRFSHLNLSSCNGSFIDGLKRYVNDGTPKDAAAAASDGTDMKFLRQFLDEAATDLYKQLETFMMKIDICRQLFGPITTAPLVKTDKTLSSCDKPELNEFFERVSRCKSAVKNLERKAELKYRDLSAMWKEGGITQQDAQFQPRGTPAKPIIPSMSFEAKVVTMSGQRPIKLTVDIQSGKLMAVKPTKNALNENNVFTHDKIEQLIKNTAVNCRLDVKIVGLKKKTYLFEDVRSRENFCQLVQQLKNMHSVNPEVKRLSIFVGTWNMASEAPNYNLTPWLKSDGLGKKRNSTLGLLPHDIYVVGTQECGLSEKEWVSKLKTMLADNFGEEFFVVTSASLWSIRVVVLAKQEHRNKISHVQQSSVKTGIANALGNKGAIGVSLSFNGTTFCFVCCHLTSGHEKLVRRNQNVRDILKGLNLGAKNMNFCDASNHFHHLFFFGDLNYRLDELDSIDIIQQIKQSNSNFGPLLEYDQLHRMQRRKEAFAGFCEEDITFPPTYRFQKFTRDRYVWEKFKATGKRINAPSWCDRVLWRSYPDTSIVNTSYGCVDSICSSDHKPVFSSFDIAVINQFTSAKGGNALSGDMKIIFEEISAEVKSTKQENFQVEFHSPCLETPVISKQNIQFGNKKDCYCCPKWNAGQLPQLQPIFDDWDYLEDQHLLLALKTVDGMESYGECVLSLKSAVSVKPQPFHTILTHVGEETGEIWGQMHLKARDNAATAVTQQRSRKVYDLIYMDTDFTDVPAENSVIYNPSAIYGELGEVPKPAATSAPVGTLQPKQSTGARCDEAAGTAKHNVLQRQVAPGSLAEYAVVSSTDSHGASNDEQVPAIPPRKGRVSVTRASSGPGQGATSSYHNVDLLQMEPVESLPPPLARFRPTSVRNSMTGGSFCNQKYDVAQSPTVSAPTRKVAPGDSSVRAFPSASCHAKPIDNDSLCYEEILRMPSSVEEWLLGLGLSQYVDDFMNKGWDHVNFLCDMAEDDLIQIGVNSQDHRTRILKSIAVMK